MDKYFRRDFSGKGKDRVFVRGETRLQVLPVEPDGGESLLQRQNLGIQFGHAFPNI
jgi:hypothetical protein